MKETPYKKWKSDKSAALGRWRKKNRYWKKTMNHQLAKTDWETFKVQSAKAKADQEAFLSQWDEKHPKPALTKEEREEEAFLERENKWIAENGHKLTDGINKIIKTALS